MNQPAPTQRVALGPKELWRILCLMLGVLTFAICAYVATHVFLKYPASMDEYNFLYQAQIYAKGKLYLNVEPYHKALAEMWMLTHNGHFFSKYPPGFSAILSIGVLMGIPEYINPIISALAIIAIACMLARMHSYFIAFVSAVFILSNSWFIGYASSLYGHATCVLLTACAFYFFIRYLEAPALRTIHYAGVCIALMVFVRPLDAACAIGAISCGLLLEQKKLALKPMLSMWAPVVVALLLFMSLNAHLRDCFCLATYRVWSTPEFHIIADKEVGFFENLQMVIQRYLDNGKQFLPTLLIDCYIPYIGYGYLAILLLGMFTRKWTRMMQISMLHIISIVALYNFNQTDGYPMYGARYWYVTWVSPSIFFANGLSRVFSLLKQRGGIILCSLLILVQLFQVTEDMYVYNRRAVTRNLVFKDINRKCPEKSIIKLGLHEYIGYWPRFFWLIDYKRNPFFKGPRLYLFYNDEDSELLKHYTDYSVCTYSFEDFRDGVYFIPPHKSPLLNYNLRHN